MMIINKIKFILRREPINIHLATVFIPFIAVIILLSTEILSFPFDFNSLNRRINTTIAIKRFLKKFLGFSLVSILAILSLPNGVHLD